MEFEKNKLIKKCLREYYSLFAETLDTNNFVPEKTNKKIIKFIYKNMAKKLKEIDIYYLLILKDKGLKLGLLSKLKVWLSGIEPIFNLELESKKINEQKKKEETQEPPKEQNNKQTKENEEESKLDQQNGENKQEESEMSEK